MRAVVYDRYGPPDVLEVRELPEPIAARGASRVRVHAAGLNPKDVLIRKGRMKWLSRGGMPRIPGYDVAGELLDPAPGLPAGTPVFGMIQSQRGGACAEVALLRHDELARAPTSIDAIPAAGLPLAALTALQALRDELAVQPGQRVLLNGASGGVGTLAIQVTNALGAIPIAVCSGRNADLVTDLGAAEVVDYSEQDPRALRDLDAVFDIYGNLGWSAAKPMLRKGGRFCTTVPRAASVARGALRRVGLHRAALVVVKSRRVDLEQLASWVDAERLRPVVDRVVSLESSDDGHRHLETRRARGKVVVDLRTHSSETARS